MITRITRDQYAAMVAADMREDALQEQVEALAFDLGWRHYHTHDSRRSPAGFPDLVLVSARSGRVLWRELKKEKGRVSPEQRAWLDDLEAAGQDIGVWRPADLISGRILAELTSSTAAPLLLEKELKNG